MFEKSTDITELAKALSLAQSKMKPAAKTGRNKFFDNAAYSTLEDIWEACREPLTEHGLSVYQSPSMTEQNLVQITTMLLHSSGQFLIDRLVLRSKDLSPQAVGSAITYGKRYSLAAVAGVASEEDDDGNLATRGSHGSSTRPAQNNQKTTAPKANPQPNNPGPGPKPVANTPGNGAQAGVPEKPKPANPYVRELNGELPKSQGTTATEQAAPPPRDSRLISENQQKRLFAIAKDKGWTTDNVKAFLSSHYGLQSTSDIPWKDYAAIVSVIDSRAYSDVMEQFIKDRTEIDGVAPTFDETEALPF